MPSFPQRNEGTPPKNPVKFILFFTRGLCGFFIAASVLNSVIAIGEALFFVCLGLVVDWTSSSTPHNFIALHGTSILVMLLCAGVILPVASVLHSLLIHQTISGNYSSQIRWQLHSYLLNQSLSFFNEEYAGSLANKVMQTSVAVRTAVMKLIDVMVHLIVYITTMLIMLSNANISLCIPLAVWLILYVSSLVCFIPQLRKASKQQSELRSTMVGRIVDSYTNISTVKLFGGHGKEEKYAKNAMDEFRHSEYRALRILTMFDVSVQFMNYTLLITLVMLSLWLWSNYLVTPGAIAIATAIAIRMINMSRWIMWEVGAIFENLGMIYDGIHTVSVPVSVRDPENPVKIDSFSNEIQFSHVSFGYKKSVGIIHDLSMKIKAGEKVGIVGPSGAGKSTLISLLLRFYDVDSGSVTIDGENIRNFTQDDLRSLFSMVSQDTSLMHRTVGENIEYGAEDELQKAELEEVAAATDSLNFIENLSDYRGGAGFDSVVGDRGVKLSGGQKQRIAIARVLVKNSPILILDEATSALDSQSEKCIQENLEKLMQGKTVIAIAHRLSTLKKMDRIVVLEKGQIVESGSHEELLKSDGMYRKLWDLQTEGFISDITA
ncbi:MAG: ABC transporter ATP-binding protein [Succinatimonas sp.]|nr:ABC transporter ATP-binding protein/permease [Succinatimonas sp.]MCI7024901.1 ABC transporter ATP-binding protein/permease [Succinatimonas sp.]MDD6756431.1 ABC transporter ATP-binding protein [Succinatimonas sp.]MDY6245632.1 ABC transporter ATP-binding protein [Succinivibrio sp.]MDY6261450.1 ABC transporter ATP-binding protein [Succinivibrio sp.]